MDFTWEEGSIRFNRDYIARIFDNLASNIVKYASRTAPIQVVSMNSPGMIGFSVGNQKAPPEAPLRAARLGFAVSKK